MTAHERKLTRRNKGRSRHHRGATSSIRERTEDLRRIGAVIHREMLPHARRTIYEIGQVLGISRQMAHYEINVALGRLAMRLRKLHPCVPIEA